MWNLLERVQILGVASLDLLGIVERCNSEFARIADDDRSHVVGQRLVALTSPQYRDQVTADLDLLKRGQIDEIKYAQHLKTPGGDVAVRIQVLLIRDETGDPEYLIAVIVKSRHNPETIRDLKKRTEQLEELLAMVIQNRRPSDPVTVNFTGTDNSQKSTADNQSQASIDSHDSKRVNQQTAIVAVGVFLVIAIVGLAAAILSR